jgi:hypothetical protein
MTDELIPAEGITRRDMLKRSAIVGGASAMVWAAPSITTFAPRAFGSNGTPASDFSNFGAIIVCVEEGQPDKYYKVKGDVPEGEEAPNFAWDPDPGQLGGCEDYVSGWGTATPAYGPDLGVSFVQSGANYVMTIDNAVTPADCTFYVVNGVAASLKQGTCCVPADKVEPYRIEWYGPFPNSSTDERCLN